MLAQENITIKKFEQRLDEEIASYGPPTPSDASDPTHAPVPVPTPPTTHKHT